MKKLQKALPVFLIIILIFINSISCAFAVSEDTLSFLENEQIKIQKRIDESEAKIKELEKQPDSQAQILTELNIQLSNLTDKYENIRLQEDIVNNKIAETTDKIANLKKEIEKNNIETQKIIDVFCKRLKANYMMGDFKYLELIVNASDYPSFLNSLELVKRTADKDIAVIDELYQKTDELEANKDLFEVESAALQEKKSELAAVETELQATLSEIKEKTETVEAELKKIENTASENYVYSEDFTPQKNQVRVKDYSNQDFIFPVKCSGCYLSSGFGYRSSSISGNAFHGGIDIAAGGIYGQPIVASKSGVVTTAEYYSDSGYGHHVIINHQNGYETLYGHCSSVIVSVGEFVEQGQVIGYAGSTGNSTGPHLHFEVRYQGEKENPMNYISF